MNTDTPDDHEHTEEAKASMAEARRVYVPAITDILNCPHTDHEHGICIECGKDITDDLIAKAEYLRDSREDR